MVCLEKEEQEQDTPILPLLVPAQVCLREEEEEQEQHVPGLPLLLSAHFCREEEKHERDAPGLPLPLPAQVCLGEEEQEQDAFDTFEQEAVAVEVKGTVIWHFYTATHSNRLPDQPAASKPSGVGVGVVWL